MIHAVRKRILFVILQYCVSMSASSHIVYIHLGNSIPPYAYVALEQARLFNEDATICLITNQEALRVSSYDFTAHRITTVACESLPETAVHAYFKKHSRLDPRGRDGFWRKATERFFYLHEYIASQDLKNVVHLEYDNMLYANIDQMADILANYKGMGAVFDCDNRCIPSFVYSANQEAIAHFVQFVAQHTHKNHNDMAILALYRQAFSTDVIDNLPLIMPEYAEEYPLVSTTGQRTNDPARYWRNIDQFESIFDGAAFGQYLGGIDPRNGVSKPGFINETCLFNPSLLTIEWRVDEKGRNVPFAICKGNAYRINNLHIHSKFLENFRS